MLHITLVLRKCNVFPSGLAIYFCWVVWEKNERCYFGFGFEFRNMDFLRGPVGVPIWGPNPNNKLPSPFGEKDKIQGQLDVWLSC